MKPIATTFFAHKLSTVLGIAILIRFAIVLLFPQIFAFDQTGEIHGSEAYDVYAQNLVETGVYGRTVGVADAQIPPLYSYMLAGVYKLFGRGYIQVALFHILLDVVSISSLYHITKRLFADLGTEHAEAIAAVTGLCYALYPYLIFQNLTLIDTPLFIAFLHAFVLVMVLLREQAEFNWKTLGLAVLGGIILGLSMLTRPIMMFLAIMVALWFLFRLRFWQTVLRLLPVATLGLLLLTIWIARNYVEFDTFIPMTTTSGSNLWQGNSPYTIPYFRAGYDVQWTSPDLDITGMTDLEADQARFDDVSRFLRENPDKIPELLWVKLLVYWSIDIAPRFNPTAGELPRLDYQGNVISATDEAGDLQLEGLPPEDPVDAYSSTLFDQVGRTVHRFYFGGLFLLALVGVLLTRRQWRSVSLLWFVQISMTMIYLIFHPSTRYRVPTDPLLFVFSAYTLVHFWVWYQTAGIGDRINRRRLKMSAR